MNSPFAQTAQSAEAVDPIRVVRIADAVMRSRKTVRAYRADPVAAGLVTEILAVASTAPSNSNSQPWHVVALSGAPKQAFGDALSAAHTAGTTPPYSHFPSDLPEPCKARQDDFGMRYYRALGVERNDAAGRARATNRNFHFFGAPVGLIFTLDTRLTKHSWLDCGLFVQSVMIAAAARGLATCPQVVFVRYRKLIAEHLSLPAGQEVACGMSLGYADDRADVNDLRMPREPVEGFASLRGFDEAQ